MASLGRGLQMSAAEPLISTAAWQIGKEARVIVYNLGCSNEHRFEGWFNSAADYDRQAEAKLVTCPMCGDVKISRLPHAARVNTGAQEPRAAAQKLKGVPYQYA